MSFSWKCDLCGVETFLNPKTEQLFEIVDGKKIPRVTSSKRYNPHTDQVEECIVPEVNYLQERCIIVKLDAGSESIKRDFCKSCYDIHIKEPTAELFKNLMSVTKR